MRARERKSNYDSFYNTAYLESIKNPNANILVQAPFVVGLRFYNSEQHVILSPANDEITERMFENCSNLKNVLFSNYIKKILQFGKIDI